MKQTIESMQDRFTKIAAEAQAIQENADKQNRQLTRNESAQLDVLLNEMDDLSGRLATARIHRIANTGLPRITTPGAVTGTASAEIKAFADFVKTGKIYNASSMSIAGGSDDGAATVPTAVSSEIREVQKAQGAIRPLATVMAVNQPVEVPIATTFPGATWMTETGSRTAQTAPVIKTSTLSGESMATVIPVTNKLLNDSAWDLNAYLVGAIGRAFGVAEAAGFLTGTGDNGQVKGILDYTLAATADGSRTWGQLEKVKTGSTSGGVTPDFVLELSSKLDPSYRKNASIVVHPDTYWMLVAEKASTTGNYLLNPTANGAYLPPLFGMNVFLDVNMPKVGEGNAPILIGDFRAGYLIQDVRGISVLRDPYATYGYLTIYAEQRIRAGVVDFNAIKVGTCEV